MEREELEITVNYDGKIRIDRYISEEGIISRNQIKERNLVILLGDREVKHSGKAQNGATYKISFDKEVEINIEPEEIPLDIIFEDRDVIVINKEQGVVVHPSLGNYHGTLVQGLMFYITNLTKEFDGDTQRPGIVHRLDKDTSGVIICAKNTDSLEYLSGQFRDRTNIKEYLAIIKGRPEKKRGTIKNYLKRDPRDRKRFAAFEDDTTGKYAETDYVVLASNDTYSLIKLNIKTGRTHQIRVHMKSLGHPILGDPIYSRKDQKYKDATLMLHSFSLEIDTPIGGRQLFTAPLPKRFVDILNSEEIEIPSILMDHID